MAEEARKVDGRAALRRELLKRELQNAQAVAQGVPPTSAPYEPARFAAQGAGATVGGVVGFGTGGPVGAAVGAGLGAAGGEEAYQLLKKSSGIKDTRTMSQRIENDLWAAGGGAGGELAGGLVGAGIRTMGKAFFRGGRSPSHIQGVIRNFETVGAEPTLGEASQSYMWQALEAAAGRTPGPHGVIIQRAERTSEQIRLGVTARAKQLGGPDLDPEFAGATARSGIENWRSRFRAEGGRLEEEFSTYLDPNTLSPTTAYSTELTKFTTPHPQAPNVTGDLINPTEKRMLDSVVKDLPVNVDVGKIGEGIPVAALLQQRTKIGELLQNFELVSPVNRGHAKDLYRALSDDIRATMVGNPQALAAFDARSVHWAQGMARLDNFLDGLYRKGVEPEKLFDAIFRGTKGTTMIRELHSTLSRDEWQIVSGSVLKRMGYKGGSEDELTWDSMRYLTQWKDMPSPTKDVLFGASGQSLFRRDLDMIADAVEAQRKMYERFGNPPKTAAGWIGPAMAGGAVASAVTGNFGFLAGLTAIGTVGWAGAKFLFTNPNFVHWLARSTTISGGAAAVSNHIGRLSAIAATSDPPTREAILDFLGMVRQSVTADWAKQQQPPEVPKGN